MVERRPGLPLRWVTSSRRPLRMESYRRGGSPPPARSERGEGPRERGQISWTASVGRHFVSNVTPPRDDRWDRDRRGLQGAPRRGVRQRKAGPNDHRPPRARKRSNGSRPQQRFAFARQSVHGPAGLGSESGRVPISVTKRETLWSDEAETSRAFARGGLGKGLLERGTRLDRGSPHR